MKIETKNILNTIAQIIFDKKGFNITAIDVKGLSSITDYIIIAEGNVDRHVQAIASAVTEDLKKIGLVPTKVEGRSSGDWIVIDYNNIMIHLFMPELREKYHLENIFIDSKIIDLEIDIKGSYE